MVVTSKRYDYYFLPETFYATIYLVVILTQLDDVVS